MLYCWSKDCSRYLGKVLRTFPSGKIKLENVLGACRCLAKMEGEGHLSSADT